MKLFTKEQRTTLLKNGQINLEHRMRDGHTEDHWPVVKLFTPWTSATWLISELNSENPDIAFGLCDLGFGSPELGSVSISEITSVKGPFGLGVERDRLFKPTMSLGQYADETRKAGRIAA